MEIHKILSFLGFLSMIAGLIAVIVYPPSIPSLVWNVAAVIWITAYIMKGECDGNKKG